MIGWQRIVKRAYDKYVEKNGEDISEEEFEKVITATFKTIKQSVRKGEFYEFRLKHLGIFLPHERQIAYRLKSYQEFLTSGRVTPYYVMMFKMLQNYAKSNENFARIFCKKGIPDVSQDILDKFERSETTDVGEL
jgi:nucleoid DNA-binding protein